MTFQSTGNNSLLWRALAISVAVHALLLSPQYSPHLMERAGAVLNATLRPLAAAEPAAAPAHAVVAAAPVQPPPAAVAPALATHLAVPAPSPVAVPPGDLLRGVSPAPTFSAAGAAGSETARAAESATAGAEKARAPMAAATGTSAAAGAGIDADGLRQYRLALAREARRFKRYPERAMLAGIGGTVQVRIDIGVDGSVRSARLADSSGNDGLDAAAVAMVRQAAPRALLPETLRGRAFPVTLSIIFNPDAD